MVRAMNYQERCKQLSWREFGYGTHVALCEARMVANFNLGEKYK